MSTPRALRQPTRLLLHRTSPPLPLSAPRRAFITLPSTSTPQLLTAHRTLPYNHARLYDLIADVDSYAGFLPYCQTSRVTAWGAPDAAGRRWPTRGDLTAGWGGFTESYSSRLFCVPARGVVEAISGAEGRSEFSDAELARYGLSDPGAGLGSGGGGGGGVFTSLVTRWTVVPAEDATREDRFQHDWSDVRLSIKYRFANPLYGAVSAAVADKVAPVMVEAFVQQARRILGEPGQERGGL
ncbi:hypothetical protein F5B20DRAFT_391160 [Whalleya microplaca]|nr:hypothetical protein F5B20DRAFT_391160 [Whalleya microplaca]